VTTAIENTPLSVAVKQHVLPKLHEALDDLASKWTSMASSSLSALRKRSSGS